MLPLEEISNWWDFLKLGVQRMLPVYLRHNRGALNQVLDNLLKGFLTAWILYTRDEEKFIVHGFLLTSEIIDSGIGERSLLIYALASYRLIPDELWEEGIEKLKSYAKSKGFKKVSAYSNVPRVIKRSEELGAKADVVYLTWEVK